MIERTSPVCDKAEELVQEVVCVQNKRSTCSYCIIFQSCIYILLDFKGANKKNQLTICQHFCLNYPCLYFPRFTWVERGSKRMLWYFPQYENSGYFNSCGWQPVLLPTSRFTHKSTCLQTLQSIRLHWILVQKRCNYLKAR